MGNKRNGVKRNVNETDSENINDRKENNLSNDELVELFNNINGEDDDSSDSEREIEESEDEDNELIEEEGETGSDAVSDEHSENEGEEESGEDSLEEEESSDDEEEESEDSEAEKQDEDLQTEHDVATVQSNNRKNSLSQVSRKPKQKTTTQTTNNDEYADHDTSDEEDIRNTIGNVPMNWYDDYKHLGYDWDGDKIIKSESGDQLDAFIKRMEDPNFWRTVKDPQTGQNVILSEEDIELIKRVKAQKIPDATFDEYGVRKIFKIAI